MCWDGNILIVLVKNNMTVDMKLNTIDTSANKSENYDMDIEQNQNNNNNINTKSPKGSNGAYKLSIVNTKEQSVVTGIDGEESFVDRILINDFTLSIPPKLKEVGYNIELSDDDTIINITSKDETYSCKIAKFSNTVPYEFSDNELEVLGINELKWQNNTSSGNDEKNIYKSGNSIGYELCFSSENNSFEGAFLQYETFNGSNEDLDDYEVDFLGF